MRHAVGNDSSTLLALLGSSSVTQAGWPLSQAGQQLHSLEPSPLQGEPHQWRGRVVPTAHYRSSPKDKVTCSPKLTAILAKGGVWQVAYLADLVPQAWKGCRIELKHIPQGSRKNSKARHLPRISLRCLRWCQQEKKHLP